MLFESRSAPVDFVCLTKFKGVLIYIASRGFSVTCHSLNQTLHRILEHLLLNVKVTMRGCNIGPIILVLIFPRSKHYLKT